MEKKWKVLLVSVVIYQFILTLMMLKLDHYAQWLHFDFDGFPHRWYEGAGTAPMAKALAWLGATALILISINVYHFRKSAKVSALKETDKAENKENVSEL